MTTVRILGSRAREQVPGTSITLLAPGFRGALTQHAAGVVSESAFDLPFGGAAAGAEIMLAAQLTLNLEARFTMRKSGLRSRSAVVAYPRIIVPRRNGVAYALLQIDETGASSFVLPAAHDETEVTFPLTIDAQGSTRRLLRVLMWPEQAVAAAGAHGVASRWEQLRRPYHLAQCGSNHEWMAPDRQQLERGAVLLLLHDTFSTAQATFSGWIRDPSCEPVLEKYDGRFLAFTHPTLSSSVHENLEWLVAQLARLPGPIDIVAHGRGGLLARALAADERLPLRRVCLVGTPNKGTPLALEKNLAHFIDAHVAMLARSTASVARTSLEGALCMLRIVALGLPARLPGVEILRPDDPGLRELGRHHAHDQQWFTVSAQFASPGVMAASCSRTSPPYPTISWYPPRAVTRPASRSPIRCDSRARMSTITTTSPARCCANDSRPGCTEWHRL
jgi:pimeloyl-ACP methyl ester carboxylesterase